VIQPQEHYTSREQKAAHKHKYMAAGFGSSHCGQCVCVMTVWKRGQKRDRLAILLRDGGVSKTLL